MSALTPLLQAAPQTVGNPAVNIGIFVAFVVVTLVIVIRASKTNASSADYYAGGRGFSGTQNGTAIAGDYLSAASFLGIVGAIALYGYDGFLYSIGFLVAWLVALLLVAELLRNTGKFTMADVLSFRLRQKPVRIAAAFGTMAVCLFYLLAQMAGAGGLVSLLLNINDRAGQALVIVIVGVLMIVYVLIGGMKGTTWVQMIKAVLLIAATAKEDIAHIAAQAAGQTPVPALKVLPDSIAADDLVVPEERRSRVLLGIGGRDIDPVTFDRQHLLAIGASGAGKSTLISTVISELSRMPREQARIVIIDPRRTHLSSADHPMVAAYGGSADSAKTALSDTAATLTSRLPGPDVTAEQLAARNWWAGPDIYVVIDDLELVDDEHLRPLLPLIPHAQDVGLHIIAARKFGGTGRALLGVFLSALKDQLPDVVIMSGTKEEGALFGVRPLTLRPGRGIFVRDNEQLGFIHIAHSTQTPSHVHTPSPNREETR